MSKAQELKPDLLPCPMCGGSEILVKKRKTTMVECKACGVVVFNYQDGIERDAIAHWNTRAPASSEQQAAQQDAERDQAIGRAVQRACADLPEGCEVVIHLEKGAGTVYMTDWDGNEYDHFQSDDGFGDVINQAIDGAIAAEEVASASNGGKS